MSLPFFTPKASCYAMAVLSDRVRALGGTASLCYGHIEFFLMFCRTSERLAHYKRLTHESAVADLSLLPLLPDFDAHTYEGELPGLMRQLRVSQQQVDELRTAFATYADALIEKISRADSVLFSATHFQLAPSLVVAHRLRRAGYRGHIVLGGYLASPAVAQELLDRHAALDSVVYGEAEDGIEQAFDACASGDRVVAPGGAKALTERPLRQDAVLQYVSGVPWLRSQFELSLEVSRGCYWDKCDFCNFNSAYEGRFKAHEPSTVIEEMDRVAATFGQRKFQFLDTAVPRRFARFLIEHNVRRDYDVFCEVRADLSRDQLRGLAQLGKLRLQAGIESLHDEHLAAMQKNATAAENVAFLEWCAELGIAVTWGVFVGHPKETPELLHELGDILEASFHLPPPKYVTRFELRAGSPLWMDRERFASGIDLPWSCFDALLPRDPEFAEFLPVGEGHQPAHENEILRISSIVERWQTTYRGTRPAAHSLARD